MYSDMLSEKEVQLLSCQDDLKQKSQIERRACARANDTRPKVRPRDILSR